MLHWFLTKSFWNCPQNIIFTKLAVLALPLLNFRRDKLLERSMSYSVFKVQLFDLIICPWSVIIYFEFSPKVIKFKNYMHGLHLGFPGILSFSRAPG